jgi:hypothetical protein
LKKQFVIIAVRFNRIIFGGFMVQRALVKIEMPLSVEQFKLPKAVNNRLQQLLDRQDKGEKLTSAERKEAEGLVNLTEMLSLLRLRSERVWREV